MAPLMTSRPPSETAYDDADESPSTPAAASDTISRPLEHPKPNGVKPLDGVTTRLPGRPSDLTRNVEIRFARFSVTTSRSPSGVKLTCAGPPMAPLGRERVESVR